MDHTPGTGRSRISTRFAIVLCLAVALVAIPAVALAVPVTTCNPSASYNNLAAISITATCSDDPPSYVGTRYWFDAAAPTNVSAWPATATVSLAKYGAHTINFFSVDSFGTSEATQTKSFTILDTLKPITISDATVVYLNSATVKLTATDTVMSGSTVCYGSGVSGTWYQLDGGAVTAGTTISTSTYGDHSLKFWSKDVANNIETTTTVSFTVYDTLAPTTFSDASVTYNNSATIKLTAVDSATGSGVAHTYYTLDGGAQTEGTTINVSTFGSHVLRFWSEDVLGNVESPVTATFTIEDTSKPRTISDIAASYLDSASIHLTATDACSGVAHTYYSLDGGPTTEGVVLEVTTPGAHSLTFWSEDVAGNVETAVVAPFFIDESEKDVTAPVTTSNAASTYAASPAIVRLTATDEAGGTGIDTLYYKVDGGATIEVKPASTLRAAANPPITSTVPAPGGHFASGTAGTSTACAMCHVVAAAPAILDTAVAPADHSTLACTACHTVTHDGGGGGGTTETPGPVMTLSANVSVSGNGAHTIEFWAKDVAGNVETHNTASFTIAPPAGDTTAPSTTSDAVATYVASAAIHLTSTDNAGGSGVAHTYYKLDGGAQTEGTLINVATVGAHSLEFWATDVAGNVEGHHVVNFTIAEETHAPEATSITIARSTSSVRRGSSFILSGVVTPAGLIGTNVQCMVQKPGRAYYSYSSLRTVYSSAATGGLAAWWYRYTAIASMAPGTYRFYAFVPASASYLSSTSGVVTVSIR